MYLGRATREEVIERKEREEQFRKKVPGNIFHLLLVYFLRGKEIHLTDLNFFL